MRVANSPIVALVVTSLIRPTSDETSVAAKLDIAVLKSDSAGCSGLPVRLGGCPPAWVTTTNRLSDGSGGAGVASEPEAVSVGSELITDVAVAQPEGGELREEERREAAGIWGVKGGAGPPW